MFAVVAVILAAVAFAPGAALLIAAQAALLCLGVVAVVALQPRRAPSTVATVASLPRAAATVALAA